MELPLDNPNAIECLESGGIKKRGNRVVGWSGSGLSSGRAEDIAPVGFDRSLWQIWNSLPSRPQVEDNHLSRDPADLMSRFFASSRRSSCHRHHDGSREPADGIRQILLTVFMPLGAKELRPE
jgi:hypothetical protein